VGGKALTSIIHVEQGTSRLLTVSHHVSATMEIAKFFYQLYKVDRSGNKVAFIGSAFTAAPNGGLLTCRHVVDVALAEGEQIAVLDNEVGRLVSISNIVFPSNSSIDLAFLPNALQRLKLEFFPILSSPILKIGEDVYSFGFFAIGGSLTDLEQGYFAGRIINFLASVLWSFMMLSRCPHARRHKRAQLNGSPA
jgi:hypothetical protein